MIRFLVVDRAAQAAQYAHEQGWLRLAANRYATPEKDDVRVVERVAELFPVGAVILLQRGPGFNENRQAEEFEALVEAGGARWVE